MRILNCLPVLLALSTLSFGATCHAQVRTKKTPPAKQSFVDKIHAAKAAFEAGNFGLALKLSEEATQIARARLREKVLAIMPEIAGMKMRKPKAQNANTAALLGLGSAAVPLQTSYTGKGRKSGQITVYLGGPVMRVQKSALQFAKMDPKIEEIKYNAHSALLKKISDTRWELTIFLAKSDYGAQIRMNGFSDEEVLKVFSQAWVDMLAKTLGLS